jgi:CO/xanthine dehydrogenase FAD-binding subunit
VEACEFIADHLKANPNVEEVRFLGMLANVVVRCFKFHHFFAGNNLTGEGVEAIARLVIPNCSDNLKGFALNWSE